jgi:hypothetical protein
MFADSTGHKNKMLSIRLSLSEHVFLFMLFLIITTLFFCCQNPNYERSMRGEDIKSIMLDLSHVICAANAILMIYLKCEYYKFAR